MDKVASSREMLLHNGTESEGKPPRYLGIVALTVETPTSSKPRFDMPPRPPPRWKTPEFIFYLFAFIIVIPLLIKIPVDLSQPTHPNYVRYFRRLSQGWIGGRQVDNSDRQYRSFRDNIPSLSLLAVGHLIASKLYSALSRVAGLPKSGRIVFSAIVSLLVLAGLHGSSILKILFILYLNYWTTKRLGATNHAPFAIWALNVSIIFLNEIYDGYKFGAIHPSLAFLDSIRGAHPRWNVTFNITMLRLISFSMDYYWALTKRLSVALEPRREKDRVVMPHLAEDYSFINYLAFAIYPPLYIAGPIMTFNNFVWQMRQPVQIPFRDVITYLVRFVACLMCMELILHYMWVVAMKDTDSWLGLSPAEISLVGFWNLIIVWLKLLIPWRFFRLWALADGMDAPENMVRCMANNYSVFGFWRSWHRSYNLWVVRYLYIPVGGSTRPILSTLVVFTFVALWHDLSFKLLTWGWLISLFVIPEMTASKLLPPSKFSQKPWYRQVCAIGAVFNILMMMAANLVGFVVGVSGTKYLGEQLYGSWQGIQFLGFACACLFIGVQVMFEYREEEMRRGIYRRC
ncbi:glycerol transporter [Tulasnella sp. 427]|nr:glycerol transporter [Tulasnella sp. 427]